MKKIWFAGMAAILALLPQAVKAQDAEAPNPDALEAKGNQPEKKAAEQKADQKTENANPFAKRQKSINTHMENFKKATRNSDKRKYREQLIREQRAYQSEVNLELKKLDDQIKPMKERLRYSRGMKKKQLETELAEMELKRQDLTKTADLEKWCAKPETLTNDSPDPGPGKKTAKNRKTKKIKRNKKSKRK